jgi:ribosomal protein L37AE/L43A
MKVIVTQKQLEQIRENASKKFSCEKCDHSWKIEKEDKHPYLCHMCGYDSHKKKYNYDELENFWKNYKKEEEVTEKWSEKYKKSINCSDPKGFSQKAHCQGRKKNLKEESKEEDKLKRSGYDIEKIKQALQMLSQISESVGEFVPLKFKLYGYYLRRPNSELPLLDLFIDVDTEDGVYNTSSENWHQIGMQLLDIFQMLGIRDERYMRPKYDFKFNKRSLDNITIV